jgi:2-C-methyl-D-erythritol 4-phosphate cytidylyltransferase
MEWRDKMISAIIVAAGKGKRMDQSINKQYIKLKDKEVLAITLEEFSKVEQVEEIIVVVSPDEVEFCKNNIIDKYNFSKVKKIVCGGKERQQSVYNGLLNCGAETDIVLIHDGARPFIDKETICKSIEGAKMNGACTVAVPVKDTIKVADSNKIITKTLKRDELYLIQTPQAFRYELILEAHKKALSENALATDDTMLVEALGCKVKIIDGDYFNIKITTPEDLIFGNAILDSLKK